MGIKIGIEWDEKEWMKAKGVTSKRWELYWNLKRMSEQNGNQQVSIEGGGKES
jgi:hypothetical protein